MKRSEIREFIRLGVAAMSGPTIEFGSGRLSEFNSNRSNSYPKVWLESLAVDTEYPASAPLDTWNIKLYVAGKDAMDSLPDQYEDLVDHADYIAQQLLYQYRRIIEGYKLTSMEGVKRDPWIKKNADDCTGVILSFNIKNADQTNVCP